MTLFELEEIRQQAFHMTLDKNLSPEVRSHSMRRMINCNNRISALKGQGLEEEPKVNYVFLLSYSETT